MGSVNKPLLLSSSTGLFLGLSSHLCVPQYLMESELNIMASRAKERARREEFLRKLEHRSSKSIFRFSRDFSELMMI
jgi:hypothetical protein